MRTKHGPRRNAPLALLCLLLAPPLAGADGCPDPDDPACRPQSGWTLCRAPLTSPVARPSAADRLRAELLIEAGRADYQVGRRALLEQGFTMSRLDQRLSAERGRYDLEAGTFHAEGDVFYQESGVAVTGNELDLRLDTSAGRVARARYALVEQHGRGRAGLATWDGAGSAALDDATYTTCDPGDPGWLLSASRIDLDFDEGLGEARNAVLRVGGVPLLYTPWAQFPIDDRRRSGLLSPSFGSSSSNGFELEVPWYWNIAPNRDATFSPRLLSKRGLQLGGEYRYLYAAADDPDAHQEGRIDLELLPDDDIYGDDRLGARLQHFGRPARRWSVGLDAGYVSDRDYLRDLGGDLAETNANYVERFGFAAYDALDWSVVGQFRYLQPLVDARPYQAMPQLLFDVTPYRDGPLRYGLDGEVVRYDRADGLDSLPEVTGTRLDLQPWLGLRAERSWGHLEPRLAVRHTGYALDDARPGSDDRPTRTLPVARLDGGLLFDRPAFGGTLRQTLEPRLFYLYVPYDNQDDLVTDLRGDRVVFDSGLPRFGWGSLFRDNRFSGADRLGDANQLSLALTSRFVDDRSGVERVRLDLGQILYFRDRRVTLPGVAVETATSSPIVGRATASLGAGFSTSAELVWNPHGGRTELGTFTLSYQAGLARLVRASYYDDGRDIQQIDIAAGWPLAGNWHGVGRWLYSLAADTSLETFAGFEYKSCCWAARVVFREFVRDALFPDDRDTALMFQLELSGLGRLGDDIVGFLGGRLPGYRTP